MKVNTWALITKIYTLKGFIFWSVGERLYPQVVLVDKGASLLSVSAVPTYIYIYVQVHVRELIFLEYFT